MPPRRPPPTAPPPPEGPLTVDSVGGEGDGVIHLTDGRLLHVPGVLPGEVVRLRAGREGPVLEAIESPSPARRPPPCLYFGTCGGCALQHWDDAAALAWKVERLRSTLALERLEAEILPVVRTAPATRRRTALHARRGDNRRIARLGFKARRSWNLVEISDCIVLDPAITAAFPGLRRLAAPFLEHPKSAPTLHVTSTGTGLDIDVTGVEARSGGLSADARMAAAEIAAELGIARLTLAGDSVFLQRRPVVQFGRARVEIPAGGFLQASAAAEAALVAEVGAAAAGARRIADLFCGAGAEIRNTTQAVERQYAIKIHTRLTCKDLPSQVLLVKQRPIEPCSRARGSRTSLKNHARDKDTAPKKCHHGIGPGREDAVFAEVAKNLLWVLRISQERCVTAQHNSYTLLLSQRGRYRA